MTSRPSNPIPQGKPDPAWRGPRRSPYRGLKSFSASDEDAELFFGRDREQRLIIANLLASRLTLLYGQSGIGKSSILCAGVVHGLRQQASDKSRLGRHLVVYVGDWHQDPHAAILDKLHEEGSRVMGRNLGPPDSAFPFDQALDWWAKRLDVQLLLILDQFEQHFLNHPPGSDGRFDRDLAGAIDCPELRLRCLISLREDALVGLDRFKGKIPNLFGNRLRLDGLTEQAALDAIRLPVERYNERRNDDEPEVKLDAKLAETVVSELQRGTSPLARGHGAPRGDRQTDGARAIEPAHLQLVMEALWAREVLSGSSSLLRIATLAEMGGCDEIVRSHVDAGLAGLASKQRAVAARTIRYLLTPSGIKVAHTSADLASYVELPEARVANTLERLCDLRIMRPLPPPEGSRQRRYEVFHDLLAEPLLEWRARFEAQRLRARARWLLAALSAAIAAALAVAAYSTRPTPLQHLELSAIDARFAVRGTVPADKDIAIVDADERTRRTLLRGREIVALRPYYAKLIDLLLAGKAKAIGVDIEFRSHGEEGSLLRAIRRANGSIVLASERFDEEGNVPLFGLEGEGGASQLLERLHKAQAGISTFPEEPKGVYRRLRYEYVGFHAEGRPSTTLLSFPVAVAKLADSVARFSAPTLIDYHGPTHTFTTVSMIDVLRGRVPASFFKGKIVVIGSSAPTAEDLHPTPFADRMPGAEIQANAISTVRRAPLLRTSGDGSEVLLVIALSLTPLLAMSLTWWLALAVFALAATGCLALVQVVFDNGVYLPAVYPLLALALAGIGTLLARFYLARQARTATRSA
jgi:CHASE2 domain-containing sensor protein